MTSELSQNSGSGNAKVVRAGGKPSDEEIARRRAEAAERKALKKASQDATSSSSSSSSRQQQQPKKKRERDPAAEADALRAWAISSSSLPSEEDDSGDDGQRDAVGARSTPRALIDVGANLHGRGASYEDVRRLVERAALAGVERVVLTGCDVEGSLRGADMCAQWAAEVEVSDSAASRDAPVVQRVFFTAGVHPHEAATWTDAGAHMLEQLFRDNANCVALGECGLDYDRMLAPRETQLAAFRAQAELAARLDAPLFVHCRERDPPDDDDDDDDDESGSKNDHKLGAYRDAVAVLRDAGVAPRRACVHCFTGDHEDLALLDDFGAWVGLTGFVGIAKRNRATLDALRARAAPNTASAESLLARLVIETDAPYMLPDKTWLPAKTAKLLGLRGGKNEPAVLPAVARALAAALGDLPPEDVARATTANARAFFRFPPS